MNEIIQEFECVKRIVVIQFYILSSIVIFCGILFGIEGNKWIKAGVLTAAFQVIVCIYMALVYELAKHRILLFNRDKNNELDYG